MHSQDSVQHWHICETCDMPMESNSNVKNLSFCFDTNFYLANHFEPVSYISWKRKRNIYFRLCNTFDNNRIWTKSLMDKFKMFRQFFIFIWQWVMELWSDPELHKISDHFRCISISIFLYYIFFLAQEIENRCYGPNGRCNPNVYILPIIMLLQCGWHTGNLKNFYWS